MQSAKKRLEQLVELAESGKVDRNSAAATAFKIAAEALEHRRSYQGKDGDERSYPDPQFAQAVTALKIGVDLALDTEPKGKELTPAEMRRAGIRAA